MKSSICCGEVSSICCEEVRLKNVWSWETNVYKPVPFIQSYVDYAHTILYCLPSTYIIEKPWKGPPQWLYVTPSNLDNVTNTHVRITTQRMSKTERQQADIWHKGNFWSDKMRDDVLWWVWTRNHNMAVQIDNAFFSLLGFVVFHSSCFAGFPWNCITEWLCDTLYEVAPPFFSPLGFIVFHPSCFAGFPWNCMAD